MTIKITHPTGIVNGTVQLSGSKSISNRALLIRSLCLEPFEITNLSDSDDTLTMERLLHSDNDILDAHHAGTTFRFMTAKLAIHTHKKVLLTGSERMKERPIGPLVNALNSLGANIEYAGQVGYPPLNIFPPRATWKSEISLHSDLSSQYISALLMIAPTLPSGLKINLIGEIVSRPYIEMTLAMMSYFGVLFTWYDQTITISHQPYSAKSFFVESDWSSASYHYSIMALAISGQIRIKGLAAESMQADAFIAEISNSFGVKTIYGDREVIISKSERIVAPFFEYDFLKCPDITQTVSVLIGGLGILGLFSGLQTLHIKETDRILALKTELAKFGVHLSKLPPQFTKKTIDYYQQEGKFSLLDPDKDPIIETYSDHRMAMSFAPIGLILSVFINNPNVVSKSYPNYWKDLSLLGFEISTQTP
jgi:3-phosphoshikimate 1-carboxyvinyltransferase